MGTEFEDTLNEITGGNTATAPEAQQEQAAPVQGNAFDESLAEKLQEPTPTPDRSHEPEGMER